MKIKCLVAIKKVINPYANLKIKTDGSGIETENMPFVMNPFDEVAIAEAVKLKQQGHIQSIMAVSIGYDCKDVLIQALARGADQALWITISNNNIITPLITAKILQQIILKNDINFALLGKQAIDDDSNQTAQMLAGLLDWPQSCFTSKITFESTENILVSREIDEGIENLSIHLPAVVSVDLSLNEPKYISLGQLLKAKSMPIEIIALNDYCSEISAQTIKILETSAPPPPKIGIKINKISELIEKLKNEEQVI